MKIHKRTLQIVYDIYDETYENLLNRSDDISIHQKHLRYLAIEVYKSLIKLNPGFIWNVSEKNHTLFNLRRDDLLFLPPVKSTRYGVNYLASRASLWWNYPAPQIKENQFLEEFKNRIKNLRSIHCTCTVCRWHIMPFYFNVSIWWDFIMCFYDFKRFYLSNINILRTSTILIYNCALGTL